MKKFDFQNTPLPDYISSLVGFTIKETDTTIDEEILNHIKVAIQNAEDYDGDLEDLLDKTFDVIRWALNLIPALEKSKLDDILINVAEYFTDAIIKRSGNKKGVKFRDRLFVRIKARKEAKKSEN